MRSGELLKTNAIKVNKRLTNILPGGIIKTDQRGSTERGKNMKKIYQKIHTYTFDSTGKENTEKSSFATLEKAIENSEMWINKTESWIDTTVKHIAIINKETNETVWEYTA